MIGILVRRNDVFYAKLDGKIGSEEKGKRPVVILQNDLGNKFSKTVIVVPITSKEKQSIPTHVKIKKNEAGLKKDSLILAEQIITIDKERLITKIGRISNSKMEEIKKAIEISIGFRGNTKFSLKKVISLTIKK